MYCIPKYRNVPLSAVQLLAKHHSENITENSRNKQLINFKLHAFRSSMIKFHTDPLQPSWSNSCLCPTSSCCICYPPISHSVDTALLPYGGALFRYPSRGSPMSGHTAWVIHLTPALHTGMVASHITTRKLRAVQQDILRERGMEGEKETPFTQLLLLYTVIILPLYECHC